MRGVLYIERLDFQTAQLVILIKNLYFKRVGNASLYFSAYLHIYYILRVHGFLLLFYFNGIPNRQLTSFILLIKHHEKFNNFFKQLIDWLIPFFGLTGAHYRQYHAGPEVHWPPIWRSSCVSDTGEFGLRPDYDCYCNHFHMG